MQRPSGTVFWFVADGPALAIRALALDLLAAPAWAFRRRHW